MSFAPIRVARALSATALIGALACSRDEEPTAPAAPDSALAAFVTPSVIGAGRGIFRYDTFGNETFWSDTAALHVKVNQLSPEAALKVGLKVDWDALPPAIQAAFKAGDVDLTSPATTALLLRVNAVVGVMGKVENGTVVRIGITCALCHSTVDNEIAPGVGHRLDGWPNRDLNVGAIIALSDKLPDAPYNTWGPGMYDPRFSFDGQNHPVVIPPAFGLRNVRKELYTGDDDVSYWNAYVAITQMHGHGRFVDPRLGIEVNNPPDLVSSKLAALRAYQFSIDPPRPNLRTLDIGAVVRGWLVFHGSARCSRCHFGQTYTDINAGRLHSPAEVGQNAAYALRSITKQYRTTPLRGLWNPPQLDGPYFHDGSAATLAAVVEHYVKLFDLKLTPRQKSDLVAFLKTL